jgi:hypothetical protein
MRYLLQKANVTHDFGGLLAERLRAINAFTSRDVVMVSRLRRSIAGRAERSHAVITDARGTMYFENDLRLL